MTSTAQAYLHVVTEEGESYYDPSEDLLFMLLEDLDATTSFMVVSRLDAVPADQHYFQVARNPDQWVVECRSGSAAAHYRAYAADMREVHDSLTTWAFRLARPDPLVWEPVVL